MDYDNDYGFPHDNLDAWTIARRARTEVRRLMASLPRGYGDDKEQVRCASGSVVRNICEGATRRGDGEKRQHFNYANAEAAETAGTVQTWVDDRVVDINAGYAVIRLYGRVGAMMHGLIRKHGG